MLATHAIFVQVARKFQATQEAPTCMKSKWTVKSNWKDIPSILESDWMDFNCIYYINTASITTCKLLSSLEPSGHLRQHFVGR